MSCAPTFGALLEAKLGPSWDENPLRRRLNFRLCFGSNFGASWAGFRSHVGRISGPNFGPRRVSKLKRPMCTKEYYLQYETMFFTLPVGSKIEGKPVSKCLQDKISFQEAQKHEKVFNIGPSWGPKTSQVDQKIKVKNHCILRHEKHGPKGKRGISLPGVLVSQGVTPQTT